MNSAPWMAAVPELKAALAAHDRKRANQAVTRLLDARAPIGEQWRGISELMRLSGELNLAHRAIDAFVAASGASPQARFAKVVLLTQSGRQREAHALLKTLPPDVPDRGGHAYVLGNVAMTLGRIDEARDLLTTAVHHRPGWGPAWLTLANVVNLASDPLGDRLLAERPIAARHAAAEHARFQYALGKLYIDRQDPDAAFAAFAEGARLLRTTTPYSRNGNAANARAAMTGWDTGVLDRLRRHRVRDTSRAIFVTGLPRSGTTLVEHILASHSDVQDGGELNIIQHIAVTVGGVSGEALQAYLDRGHTSDELAGLYLHLLAERHAGPGRIVDKTVDVSRFMGLIAAALPDSPILWMRRDPLDNAWSCFRTFFIHGVAWSYDLADIAHHFQLEDELCTFWQQRLGNQLLVVPYPALIDDPAGWTRRLLDHCGLADEAGSHEAHKTDRVVATASALQVRRPINRDGLGVAEPYRRHLQPFIDAYSAP